MHGQLHQMQQERIGIDNELKSTMYLDIQDRYEFVPGMAWYGWDTDDHIPVFPVQRVQIQRELASKNACQTHTSLPQTLQVRRQADAPEPQFKVVEGFLTLHKCDGWGAHEVSPEKDGGN